MKITTEKVKRNRELLADHQSGKFTSAELVAKYNISTARVYEIIRSQELKGGEKK